MRYFFAGSLMGLAVCLAQAAHAQQPFERFGLKVKVATLSNGRYPEFFRHDSLRRIGSVVYNTRMRQIAYLLPGDSLVGRAKSEVTSRWMSPDPLAEEFMSISPYVYVSDNPVNKADPDGREEKDVILGGPKRQEAFQQLQASVKGTLNLSMDSKTGNVTYTTVQGATPTGGAAQLATAIDDHSVKVNVIATEDKYDVTGSGSPVVTGAFLGNTVTPSSNPGDKPTVETRQQVNPVVAGKIDNNYQKPGATTLHEVVESYLGGKISQASGVSAGNGLQSRAVYNAAHAAAPKQGGNIYVDSYDATGTQLKVPRIDPRGCADVYVKDANGNPIPVQKRP